MERLNAVLRFLFAAVIIDEHRGKRDGFDDSRIEIEPSPLSTPAPGNPPHYDGEPVITTGRAAPQTRVRGSPMLCDGLIGVLSWESRW